MPYERVAEPGKRTADDQGVRLLILFASSIDSALIS